MNREALEALPLVAHEDAEWDKVRRTTYVVRQHLHYQYPVPICGLRQRLILVPPRHHGDQQRVGWGLEASCPARRRQWRDRFGNLVVDLEVDDVEATIDFEAWTMVERRTDAGPHRVGDNTRLARASRLTAADEALTEAARQLLDAGPGGLALGERICDWVYEAMAYRHDVTSIHTTAARALSLGAGVCQDYAHIALAICRQAGLPARYVSGHLLGIGGSHAWVEVMLEDPDRPSGWIAVALDPTHNRRAGLNYLTIATGRDYHDVAPTSGSYRAAEPGELSVRKQAWMVEVVYQED